MKRKMALVLSGIVTAFVMVSMIGLFGLSANQSNTVRAAPPAQSSATGSFDGSGQGSTDVATLRAEVVAYQQQLREAYLALQQAYNEIQLLSGNESRNFRNGGGSGQPQFFDQAVGR